MLCAGVNLGNWDLDVALGVQFDDNCLTGQNVKNTICTTQNRSLIYTAASVYVQQCRTRIIVPPLSI